MLKKGILIVSMFVLLTSASGCISKSTPKGIIENESVNNAAEVAINDIKPTASAIAIYKPAPTKTPTASPIVSSKPKTTNNPTVNYYQTATPIATRTPLSVAYNGQGSDTANKSYAATSKPTPVPTVFPTTKPTIIPTAIATSTPEVTAVPQTTKTPEIIVTPEITATSEIAVDPSSMPTVEPTKNPTKAPETTVTPETTITPESTVTYKPSIEPSAIPSYTPTVEPVNTPAATPETTTTPETTLAPSALPTASATVESTATPEVTSTPEATIVPTVKPTEITTATPDGTSQEEIAQLQAKVDKAQAQIDKGSYGFFESVGASDALAVLDNNSIKSYTVIGGAGDTTALDNMKKALEMINDGNTIRINDVNLDGTPSNLSPLMISDYAMAVSQVQTNASATTIGHTNAFSVSENLSWGSSTPYSGWYDAERATYINAVNSGNYPNMTDMTAYQLYTTYNDLYLTVGHYLNVITSDTTTGAAVNTNPNAGSYSKYGPTCGQVFTKGNGYSFGEYYNRFMAYYDNCYKDLNDAQTALNNALN